MSRFCVDPTSSPLRRRLGPAPWFVLEELMLIGAAEGAATNVRSLAAGLSLNKDTVARALIRLRATGLVVVEPQGSRAGRTCTKGAGLSCARPAGRRWRRAGRVRPC